MRAPFSLSLPRWAIGPDVAATWPILMTGSAGAAAAATSKLSSATARPAADDVKRIISLWVERWPVAARLMARCNILLSIPWQNPLLQPGPDGARLRPPAVAGRLRESPARLRRPADGCSNN